MNEHTDREAMLREIARKRVVYQLPGMDALRVRRDLTYRSTSGAGCCWTSTTPRRRQVSIRRPSSAHGVSRPDGPRPCLRPPDVVGAADGGFGHGRSRLRSRGAGRGRSRGAATLRADADALGLDVDKFGLFAASGNVTVALSALMRDRRLRCAALLYGYTMDMDGSTAVADMGRQAGFVNACAGRSSDDLPDGVPCSSYAQGATISRLNEALDRVVARALARNLPLSLINHATGGHGFDLDENTAISRGIVQQVLAFLQLHLSA